MKFLGRLVAWEASTEVFLELSHPGCLTAPQQRVTGPGLAGKRRPQPGRRGWVGRVRWH